jgi:hypothetical protein
MSASRRAGPLALAFAAAAFAGCDRGPATPRAAWDEARGAIESRDPKRLHALLDQESQEERRQGVRMLRGLIARGDPPAEVLAGTEFAPADVLNGTPDDAIGVLMSKGSPFVRDSAWFLSASVAEETADGQDASKLVLRGADGRSFDCWFVREERGWAIDFARTWSPPR